MKVSEADSKSKTTPHKQRQATDSKNSQTPSSVSPMYYSSIEYTESSEKGVETGRAEFFTTSNDLSEPEPNIRLGLQISKELRKKLGMSVDVNKP